VSTAFLAANCDKAGPGWPCDEELEKLRDQFAHEGDPAKQKALAEQVQLRAIEVGTHVWVGQWYKPLAYRKDRVEGWLYSPVPLFWNVTKKSG
jgi:peptide/nickel transport system substrate-binding protein